MNLPCQKPARVLLLLSVAALATAAPIQLSRNADTGIFGLELSLAHARRGADDKGGDDRGGRDRSSDDRGGDDRGRNGGSDDDDDHRSRSRSSDDHDGDSHRSRSSDDRGGSTRSSNGGGTGNVFLAKFELSSRGVEVVYSDGTKEEIENGRYGAEFRPPDGRAAPRHSGGL